MSEKNSKPKKLSLSGSGKLTLGGGGLDQTTLRSGVAASRGKNVQVEVRRKRVLNPALRASPSTQPETLVPKEGTVETSVQIDDHLTAAERANRIKVLQEGLTKTQTAPAESSQSENDDEEKEAGKKAIDPRESRRRAEMAELAEIEKKAAAIRQTEMERLATENAQRQARSRLTERDVNSIAPLPVREGTPMRGRRRPEEAEAPRRPANQKRGDIDRRRTGKITISQALSGGDSRQRSLASVRRQREKARMREDQPQVKQVRDVVIPDTITVQELANRMAERAADIVKELMKQGIMATVTQTIDAETAELVTMEFGHRVQRVSESDIEDGLTGAPDNEADLKPRPPVVTVMGHVDHGKTSLLDAMRATDVAAGESGGITQHIGAYQIKTGSGNVFTFIDTPGHEAFTEMRSRGAVTTDIVVLVVAADDSVKAQTIEAINHAKAAGCPIIVAVNKCDKPEADPRRVRNDLLQHEIVTEDFGGDILCVDVSAHTGAGLDKLEEAILLQAELLELKANPDRDAEGTVVEAKVERGRGSVATVLVQRGTLRVGDVFVTGAESGRVRALLNDKGKQLKSALPGQPVEVLGLNGTPMAGDQFSVVETESRAREIAEYRSRRNRDKQAAVSARGSVEQMLTAIAAGEAEELPIVIKTDVHGSLEAIRTALDKLGTEQVKARILTGGVGALSESDISLAAASQAMVIGFNVRAIPQARDLAKRDNVEIRYHSIIYELIDEVKAAMGGLLSPDSQEDFIGYAEIRQVFSVSKSGKVAGCMVTEGIIKRGCKVRLLRDNVVIHEGLLKTLRRFKDEVKEVRESMECGMAFENYSDIQEGDMIECFEITEVARTLD
ncbi:MAG: translation initiation factor IF-2 [SAR116 cluster bacterium]|nr:translation initiation factor IF-2 [SAR116 cluster bacterium]RPG90614.1 MAG: translation initiation factor IF-2 [Candidatus Puniceispirillum sp. TMED213]